MDKALASLEVAVLLHDPPWKPWGIGVAPYSLEGCGSEPYWACLARALRPSKALSDEARRAALDAVEEYRRYGHRRSHELQAALLARVIAAELEARGMDEQASVASKAERLILDADERLQEADTMASAIDRLVIPREANASEPVFINPFNPNLRRYVQRRIDAWSVAGYIARLASEIAGLLAKSPKGGETGLLVHAIYSLLEPVWYSVFSPDPLSYMPPADTRLPTHTVFDHLNAALAALNWVSRGGRPSGCVALVDLAGIQSWIGEARRLRDLWASSWLVSLLAWKSVEPLVDRYGPGVLVQPPARLNPFYASWLLGAKLKLRPEGEARRYFEILGLPLGWPLDPMVPGSMLLALPEEACPSLESEVYANYRKTWNLIAGRTSRWLKEACKHLEDAIVKSGSNTDLRRLCPALEAVDLIGELEPPLGVRIVKIDVGEAVEYAREVAEQVGLSDYRGLLYPIITLILLPKKRALTALRLPGRLTGPRYMEYAKKLHSGGSWRLCTVCGRGLAAIDGKAIVEEVGKNISAQDSRVERVIAEVGGERLCPYCLAKRLLRRLLAEGLAEELTGLPLTEEASERLGRGTVDYFTTRTHLGYQSLKNAVEALIDLYKRDEREFTSKVLLDPKIYGAAVARNKFLTSKDRKSLASPLGDPGIVEVIESIVLEAAHSRRYWEYLQDRVAKVSKDTARRLEEVMRSVWGHARRIAILRMDADNMGKRVLRGALPWSPEEYAGAIINIADPGLRGEVARSYRRVVGSLEGLAEKELPEALGKPGSKPARLVAVPTLSYHFTISRALAALAFKDREVIESNGGTVIYAGGDDLLAILPPARSGGQSGSLIEASALTAAFRSRRNYWGADESGFLLISLGERVPARIPIPAPVAYGRSGVLLYVDPLHPLWANMSLAHKLLEEAKTGAKLYSAGAPTPVFEKDVLVHAGESSGVSLLPQSTAPPRDLLDLASTAKVVEAAVKLGLLTEPAGKGASPLSRGVHADMLWYINLLAAALTRQGGPDYRAALLVIEKVIARNISTEKASLARLYAALNEALPAGKIGTRRAAKTLLRGLAGIMGIQQEDLVSKCVGVSGSPGLVRYLEASGFSFRIRDEVVQPLILALLGGIKVFREAV